MELARLSLIFFSSFAVLMPCLSATDNEVWRRRAEEDMHNIDKYFDPDPAAVVSHLNMKVQEATKTVASRRGLLSADSGGACEAGNPIDKCWRCRPDWAEDRQALADCALGFGKGVTGGKGGPIYEVNDPSDDDRVNPKKGTLRHAVIQNGPLWIIFAKDMNIKLEQELLISSDKTIDGRGAEVHITDGAGLTMQRVKNVIIHGIHVHDTNPCKGGLVRKSVDDVEKKDGSDGDAISVYSSQNIWIDHVTLAGGPDGLIDCTQGSTAITLSNNHLSRHDKTILLGSSDEFKEDKKMQVTVAFNKFDKELTQRLPAIRHGFVHVVNNDYHQWKMYAVGGQQAPTILCQGNRFDAGEAKQVTKRMNTEYEEWKNWIWRSEGDLFLNGAFFNASGENLEIQYPLNDLIKPAPGTEVEMLTNSAGALVCKPGSPC